MRRKALCDFVVGATRIQGPEIGGSLGDYLSPVLGEGETLPDLATPMRLYGRKLQSFSDAMVATDERYLAEIAGLDAVQAEVEAPMRQLAGELFVTVELAEANTLVDKRSCHVFCNRRLVATARLIELL